MLRNFSIGGRSIGPRVQPYIIAEVGINHNGKLDYAIEMVKVAKNSGADAIKFQTFKANEFCGDPKQIFSYLSQGASVSEPMLEMFSRLEMPTENWEIIKKFADEIGIHFFSSPQNVSDLEILLPLGVPAIKIGSDDLTNLPLIREYASRGLPIIISTGMSDIGEVNSALEAAGFFDGAEVAALVCTSEYPAPLLSVNINRVKTLQKAFPGLVVGFSDHTQGNIASTMAVALGASIFEKHFTLDHDLSGPDHWFSMDPTELNHWVTEIRGAYGALGNGMVQPTPAELVMRKLARRSLVAIKDIPPGATLTDGNIGVRRPGDGLSPSYLPKVLGKRTLKGLKRGEILGLEHLM